MNERHGGYQSGRDRGTGREHGRGQEGGDGRQGQGEGADEWRRQQQRGGPDWPAQSYDRDIQRPGEYEGQRGGRERYGYREDESWGGSQRDWQGSEGGQWGQRGGPGREDWREDYGSGRTRELDEGRVQFGRGRREQGYGGLGSQGMEEQGYRSYRQAGGYGGQQGRGPKGYQRSDERIREEICERLTRDDFIDASEVTVEVKERKVILSGTVPERNMKHAIEDIADHCSGVQDVENQIRVAHGGDTQSAQQPGSSTTGSSAAGRSAAASESKSKQ